jgi:dihydroorotase
MMADLVLVRREDTPYTITSADVLSKCGWSPREGDALHWRVMSTWVNGSLVWDGHKVDTGVCGEALRFA